MNSKKNLLAATVGFFMGAGGESYSSAEETQSAEGMDWLLEEVVVTANKREQSLQDTAMALSVLSSDTIKNRGLFEMDDYLNTLPGVTYINQDPTRNNIIIRGMGLNGSNDTATVSAYLGEMPMNTAAESMIDIRLIDIERVEVLKGPQGTLYGSGSLSGTVKSMPVAPDLNQLEGSISVDAYAQSESDDLGHSFEGIINIPLIDDQLALRVAGYRNNNAGYIDSVSVPYAEDRAAATGNTVFVKKDNNSSVVEGVRASLLWQATDDLKLTLMLGTQDLDTDGVNESLESSDDRGDYDDYQVTYLNGGRNDSNTVDYGNLTIDYDLSWGVVTFSSSQVETELDLNQQGFTASHLETFRDQTLSVADLATQELRFASEFDGALQFVGGLFWEDVEQVNHYQYDLEGDSPTFLRERFRFLDYSQKAIFGEVSYQFDDHWALTLGGRHFDYERTDGVIDLPDETGGFGVWGSAGNATLQNIPADETGQTYKANLSFTPNDDILLYVQYAEGFRLGKGQDHPGPQCDLDLDDVLDGTSFRFQDVIASDTSENFELGAKLTLLDNRLTLNTAIYQIDWTNLPVVARGGTTECTQVMTVNVGEARSEGVEIEANYAVTSDLQVNLSASYIDASVTKDLVVENIGRELAFANDNASLGVQYGFDLMSYRAFIRSDISYVGPYDTHMSGLFPGGGGDYVKVDLRASVNINQLSLALYASNLTNDDTTLYDSTLKFDGFRGAVTKLPPRKIGFSVDYIF